MIRYDKMPLVRIIPLKTVEGITKKIVIASTYSFGISSPGTFEMDFGTLYGIPLEQITDEGSSFRDIIPVANFHPSAFSETTPVAINEIYSGIVSEIEKATERSANSLFKLSNISLKLKAMVHKDGEAMSASLLDMINSEDVNGNAISEILFDITPNQTGVVEGGRIPDLIGLTETAVRRVLKTYDLKLNPVYQQNIDVVNGDSFKQSPNAGGRVPENKVITVIFSKNEQS
ncbi:PASTA domain protein [compost metagenome]